MIEFPKIPRWSRDIVITEKIDGTNAGIQIVPANGQDQYCAVVDGFALIAQSRSCIIMPGKHTDNYGFAQWVAGNALELVKLGEGVHFGEWWGAGIGRKYDLTERRFSLFNAGRWNADDRPRCCFVVPTLYSGPNKEDAILGAIRSLETEGSQAAPGFMRPEGIIIFHTKSRQMFKKTVMDDDKGKESGG